MHFITYLFHLFYIIFIYLSYSINQVQIKYKARYKYEVLK